MEEVGSEELAQKISDFANDLQADSNTAAIKKFQKEGSRGKMALAFLGKTFDNFRYVGTMAGIG